MSWVSRRPLSKAAQAIVARMRETGAPIVVSAKIKRRPAAWRDRTGHVGHSGYPLLSEQPGAFTFTVAGEAVSGRGVLSLCSASLLQSQRLGWKVRTRYRLREAVRGR